MKKILQAIDGASAKKPVGGSSDMKKFLQIIESTGPSNRLTQAESIAVQTYTAPEPRKTVTSPVLNVNKDAHPSMVGKYFKQIEEEFKESEHRYKDRARQLAERVVKKIAPQTKKKLKEETEGVDSVTLDIPLLIRLMEFAREDAQDDMTLHQIAERMIGMKEEGQALSMSDYEDIVGSVNEAHGNSKIYDKCWTGYKRVTGKKSGEDGSCVKK